MALINLGSMATDVRNSVGAVTFSRNKGGAYVRAKVSPVQPRTPAQTRVRANFAANSKLWSGTLTSAQQAAWTFFAASNPLINVFGNSIVVSGLAIMMKLNQILSQIGVAPITDPPSDLSVPALANVLDMAASEDADTVTFDTAAQAVVAGAKYYIFATAPLAPGKKPGTSDYRFIGTYAAVAAAVSIDISTNWKAIFGDVPTGKTIGGLVATVNTATGAVTPGLVFTCQAS
jgi:hypothetical protein